MRSSKLLILGVAALAASACAIPTSGDSETDRRTSRGAEVRTRQTTEAYDYGDRSRDNDRYDGRSRSDTNVRVTTDNSGYDQYGYDRNGYDRNGLDRQGRRGQYGYSYDYGPNDQRVQGSTGRRYDASGFDEQGYDRAGFDRYGYMRDGFDRYGFDRSGYDRQGRKGTYVGSSTNVQVQTGARTYDAYGYDQAGYGRDGYDRSGYDRSGFDRSGINRQGYDAYGARRR